MSKKIYSIISGLLMTASVFLPQQASAQSPEKMSYQAIVRDGSNALVTSTVVGMQISILQGTSSGTAVYVETQTQTSNANGLVSIEIGAGTPLTGAFSDINWANGPYFIKTETDPTGGSNYTITGTSELLSVPYALHAKNSDSWSVNGDSTFTFNNVGIGISSPTSKFHLVEGTTYDIKTGINNYEALKLNSLNLGTSPRVAIEFLHNDIAEWRIGNDLFANGVTEFSIWDVAAGAAGKRLVINSTGNVGVNTTSPARSLHVNDVMRLEPRSSAPNSASAGDIYFDSTLNKLRVYDGTAWQNCW